MNVRPWDWPSGFAKPGCRRPVRLRVFPSRAGLRLTLAVRGELDISTAAELGNQLTPALSSGAAEVIIDVTDLTFCDLIGLDALQDAQAEAAAAGVSLSLRGMSRRLAWLLVTFPAASDGDDGRSARRDRVGRGGAAPGGVAPSGVTGVASSRRQRRCVGRGPAGTPNVNDRCEAGRLAGAG